MPEPRPFKGLPGRNPNFSVFSISPQLQRRFNKKEQLYGRFFVPLVKNKVRRFSSLPAVFSLSVHPLKGQGRAPQEIDPLNEVDIKPIVARFISFPARLIGRSTVSVVPPPRKKRRVSANKDEAEDGKVEENFEREGYA